MNALITLATPEIATIAKPFIDNQRAYGERHGYQVICHPAKVVGWEHLHPSFSKVPLIDQALKDGFDYVVFADADVGFTNFTRDIKDIIASKLKDRPELWLTGKIQQNWATWVYICNGLLCFRNTPDARSFMDVWIDYCLNGTPNIEPGKRVMMRDHPWEQYPFDMRVREIQYHGVYGAKGEEIGTFAREIWTDGDDFRPGYLSVHFAGPATFERRAQVFTEKYQPLIVR